MTDDSFFPGLQEYEKKRAKERGDSYGKRVLKKLIKMIDPEALPRLQEEAGADFGLDWFNDTQSPPILLAAVKMNGVTKAALLSKKFLDGQVAKAYFDEYQSYGADGIGAQLGVIFPLDGSEWVITDGQLEIRGACYVQLHGMSDDVSSLAVLRLEDFAKALKRQGYGF